MEIAIGTAKKKAIMLVVVLAEARKPSTKNATKNVADIALGRMLEGVLEREILL